MGTISKIKAPDGTTYNIDAVTVNGKTVAVNVPSNAIFTDTTYSAGTGLEFDENNTTKLKHTNSITAGTIGSTSDTSSDDDDYFNVPYISYDKTGHIIGGGMHRHTIGRNIFVNNKQNATNTLTGNLTISKSSPAINIKATDMKLDTSSTNDGDGSIYLEMLGSNGSMIGLVSSSLWEDIGSSHCGFQATNKKTNGTTTTESMGVWSHKDGSSTYDFSGEEMRTSFSIQTPLSTETYGSGTYQRCYGKVVQIRITGTKGGSLPTVASGIRPPSTYYNPAIILGTGDKWYKGWIGITSAGAITARAVLSGTTATEVTNNSDYTIYGTITYIIS